MVKYQVYIVMTVDAKDEEEAEDWAVHSFDEHDDIVIDRIVEA